MSYTLVGADGAPYRSTTPGTLGGHRKTRIYGRLDCPGAARWIARGHYVRHRVFFADRATARAAGYRPCAVCLRGEYRAWKTAAARNRADDDGVPRGMDTALDIDGDRVGRELDEVGIARLPALLDAATCRDLTGMFDDDDRFRSTVVMARHSFGLGSYRYFAEPLPEVVATLRRELYPPLAGIANRWAETLGERRFPDDHAGFRAECAAGGQTKPTPLLLRYGEAGYNCLHQDVYGDLVFPLQVAVMLSEPDVDFTGGESVFVEQRPRQQSRPVVARPGRGDAIVFPVHHRPRRGARGYHRVQLRHGVSAVHSGQRHVLGVIFHDAR